MDARTVQNSPAAVAQSPASDTTASSQLGGVPASVVRGLVTHADGLGTFHLVVGDRVLTGHGASGVRPGMLVDVRLGHGDLATLISIVTSVVRADDVRTALAAAASAATNRATTVPGRESALGQLADALRLPHVPSPPLLAASLAAFVRELIRAPESPIAQLDTGHTYAEQTLTSQEHHRSLGSLASADLQAEGQRVVSQLLAEGRAEFPIPVDLPGRGWVRLRLGGRRNPSKGSEPGVPASLALLVELPAVGATLVEATFAHGGIDAAITTVQESTAQLLNDQRRDLEAGFHACGLQLHAIRIEADAARVAREWTAWPVPTLEGGSLIDTRA